MTTDHAYGYTGSVPLDTPIDELPDAALPFYVPGHAWEENELRERNQQFNDVQAPAPDTDRPHWWVWVVAGVFVGCVVLAAVLGWWR
jgi:hypothetical protein